MKYELLDSGFLKKLEKIGPYTLIRPALQALWKPETEELWKKADAEFDREKGWTFKKQLPESWKVEVNSVHMKVALTDFGHIGLFPEHAVHWDYMLKNATSGINVLNLFAYSGGATIAAAKAGCRVCHVDASKGMVDWARENSEELNKLSNAPVRWIVDDVMKFLAREIRRGQKYEGIILDPPTFGRGKKGEVFKLEESLPEILEMCRELLSYHAKFVILSCHTPGVTPTTLSNLLSQAMKDFKGKIVSGEMAIQGVKSLPLPSGCYARWSHE